MESKFRNKEFNIWAFGDEKAWSNLNIKYFNYWMDNHSDLYKPVSSNCPIDDIIIMYDLWEKNRS